MRKLKLTLEALSVDSFTTAQPERPTGTVKGHDNTVTCPAYATYEYVSCYQTDCGSCYSACNCTGGGGTANTQCGQYTCATPESECPY